MIRETADRAARASRRIAQYIERTPLQRSEAFSESLQADIFFKLENRQTTGSFKLRGAMNRLLTLSDEQKTRGCVAASSGNHGAAVACAMHELGLGGVIFVPEHTSPAKVAKIQGYGGEVRHFGTDGLDTEQHARAFAAEHGMCYVSPYNDEQVIAGQGTCGIEIVADVPDIDMAFIAVGGGGLIGGAGSVLKQHNPGTRVYGCQPLASPIMARSIAAGEILDMPSEETLSDGTAGGIEPGAITFPLNEAVVDDWIVVDEDRIADAMRLYMKTEGEVIEGAAGVAIAGLLDRREDVSGKKVVVVICGGNVSDAVLRGLR